MASFNFSSLIDIYMRSTSENDVTLVVQTLLDPITAQKGVVNSKGKPYKIIPREANDFYESTQDIYKNLRDGLTNFYATDENNEKLEFYILSDLNDYQSDELYSSLLDAAKKSDLDSAKKNAIEDAYHNGDMTEFFRLCYFYALLENNNTKSKRAKKQSRIQVKDLLEGLIGKKPDYYVPKDIKETELPYINELLAVYSEKDAVTYSTINDLKPVTKYSLDIEQHRKYYYSAECIRIGLRDTEVASLNLFEKLEDDVYNNIFSIINNDSISSYERLNTTMDKLDHVVLGSALAKFTDWVTTSERKGVCHTMVNSGKIKWVK